MNGFAIRNYVSADQRGWTFGDALDKLGNRDRKKLENNTYLHRLDANTLAVRLHSTDIVLVHGDGTYTLDSGGWRTLTTRDRISRYSPAGISQKNNIWYVGASIFQDGMRVNAQGTPVTRTRRVDVVERNKRLLDRRTRAYIDGFAAHVIKHGLAVNDGEAPSDSSDRPLKPDTGDCWPCYFGLGSDDHLKEPMGVDHLLSHFEEDYFVPSLLWKAILSKGYSNPGLTWYTLAEDAKRGDTRLLKDILRAYFRKRKPALLDRMAA